MRQYLDAGTIVNTHGIRGEVRLLSCTDSPDFLLPFKTLYIDGKPHKVKASRVHKSFVLLWFEGVDDINAAMKLKGRAVQFDRDDAKLDDGAYFLDDLVGFAVRDEDGNSIGTLKAVERYPGHDVYVVMGEREILIPAVPAFVKEKDFTERCMVVSLIEGM
jgi:16S rRNA processing protein RimM